MDVYAVGYHVGHRRQGGPEASRKNGLHVLRHTYASIILEARESVVTLARWLGRSSPTLALDHCVVPAYVPEKT